MITLVDSSSATLSGKSFKLFSFEDFGILDITRMDHENVNIMLLILATRMSFSFDSYFDTMRLAFFHYRICYIPEHAHIAIWTIEIKSRDADTSFDLVYSQSLPQNLPHKEDRLTTHISMNENKRNGLPSTDISAVLVSHWSLINLMTLHRRNLSFVSYQSISDMGDVNASCLVTSENHIREKFSDR